MLAVSTGVRAHVSTDEVAPGKIVPSHQAMRRQPRGGLEQATGVLLPLPAQPQPHVSCNHF